MVFVPYVWIALRGPLRVRALVRVRGQRTRTNARTRKGPRKAIKK